MHDPALTSLRLLRKCLLDLSCNCLPSLAVLMCCAGASASLSGPQVLRSACWLQSRSLCACASSASTANAYSSAHTANQHSRRCDAVVQHTSPPAAGVHAARTGPRAARCYRRSALSCRAASASSCRRAQRQVLLAQVLCCSAALYYLPHARRRRRPLRACCTGRWLPRSL